MFSKKFRITMLLVLSLTLAAALVGCGGNNDQNNVQTENSGSDISGTITAVGSSALQPLVEEAANQYMAENNNAQIVVQGGGSGTGLTQVASGAADIGNSDIFAEEKEGIDASELVDHKVAVVGMAAVVNPEVGVDNLTKAQLKDIFTGKVKNWKELGGNDQEIIVIHRAKGSGTRATFESYALDGAEGTAPGMEQDSNGTVRKMVAETPGAISYLAFSYINDSMKALKLDGVEPTAENIINGSYPVWSYEHMYTKGEPSGLAKDFLDYMLSDEVQSQLVEELGYIPATKMTVERDAQGSVTKK